MHFLNSESLCHTNITASNFDLLFGFLFLKYKMQCHIDKKIFLALITIRKNAVNSRHNLFADPIEEKGVRPRRFYTPYIFLSNY